MDPVQRETKESADKGKKERTPQRSWLIGFAETTQKHKGEPVT